jgi:hypothetical protein
MVNFENDSLTPPPSDRTDRSATSPKFVPDDVELIYESSVMLIVAADALPHIITITTKIKKSDRVFIRTITSVS